MRLSVFSVPAHARVSLSYTCLGYRKGTVNELLQRSKSIMNNLAFKTAVNTRGVVDDHDKPLMIAAGADSFKAIGEAS